MKFFRPKKGKEDYIFKVEMYIDGKLDQVSELPANFTIRKNTPFWIYQLPMGKHIVRFKVLNSNLRIKNSRRKMNVLENLHYTKEHEWALVEDDVATVLITDYAQSESGDIVFVEFPKIGESTKQIVPCASIEAVKPISNEVVEVNNKLELSPQLVNSDPYGEGWILKVKLFDKAELNALLSPDEYMKLIG